MRNAANLRLLIPQPVRERLYAWHPGRARRWRLHPGIERVESAQHAVLTFDDGPDDDATLAVLDALDQANAKATFFLLGVQLARHPELGREIVRRGHEVGLHGYDHLRHDRVDPETTRSDLARGLETIEQTLGIRCRWFRPPYGKMSDAADVVCQSLNLTPVYWSSWGLDWESVSSDRIAREVLQNLAGGAIVLLHDSAFYGRRVSATPTAEAISTIARSAREQGLSLVPLGEAPRRQKHVV